MLLPLAGPRMPPPIAVALLFAVAGPPIELRPEAPDAGCPRAAEVSTALRAHVAARASERAWALSYATSTSETGERTLRLELLDATGVVRLRRQLAVSPDGCGDAAEAVALVVERYFTGIGWTAGSPPATPAPATAAEIPPSPVVRRPRLVVLAGPALLLDGAATLRAAIDLRWNPFGPVTVGAGVLLPGRSRDETKDSAHVHAAAWPARVSLLAGRAFGPRFALDGGLDGYLALESASADGIATAKDGRRLVANLGLAAVGTWRFAPRWQIAVEAGGYRHFGPAFEVEVRGQLQPVLQVPNWQAAIMARLGFALGQ
jgi:hypothetical protein